VLIHELSLPNTAGSTWGAGVLACLFQLNTDSLVSHNACKQGCVRTQEIEQLPRA